MRFVGKLSELPAGFTGFSLSVASIRNAEGKFTKVPVFAVHNTDFGQKDAVKAFCQSRGGSFVGYPQKFWYVPLPKNETILRDFMGLLKQFQAELPTAIGTNPMIAGGSTLRPVALAKLETLIARENLENQIQPKVANVKPVEGKPYAYAVVLSEGDLEIEVYEDPQDAHPDEFLGFEMRSGLDATGKRWYWNELNNASLGVKH